MCTEANGAVGKHSSVVFHNNMKLVGVFVPEASDAQRKMFCISKHVPVIVICSYSSKTSFRVMVRQVQHEKVFALITTHIERNFYAYQHQILLQYL